LAGLSPWPAFRLGGLGRPFALAALAGLSPWRPWPAFRLGGLGRPFALAALAGLSPWRPWPAFFLLKILDNFAAKKKN